MYNHRRISSSDHTHIHTHTPTHTDWTHTHTHTHTTHVTLTTALQESPPALTQEAYRPPCSCSVCTPIQSQRGVGEGVASSSSDWGYPIPHSVPTGGRGYPHPVPIWVPPSSPDWGYPVVPACQDVGGNNGNVHTCHLQKKTMLLVPWTPDRLRLSSSRSRYQKKIYATVFCGHFLVLPAWSF